MSRVEASHFEPDNTAILHSPIMRIHLVLSILGLVSSVLGLSDGLGSDVGSAFNETEGRHTNNWAVLVDTSRYWFNYRVCRDVQLVRSSGPVLTDHLEQTGLARSSARVVRPSSTSR